MIFAVLKATRFQRVALDEDYDRLTEKHVQKFACAECSAKKEIERKKGASGEGK